MAERRVFMTDYIKRIMENNTIPGHLKTVLHDEMYHGIEVSNLAVMIAEEMGENHVFCKDLSVAGMLHDIGKLKLADYIFLEEDTLVIEQMKYVRQHSLYSYKILKEAGYNNNILNAVFYHHENYDGSGYPDNLKGDKIPWMARILRTCDVFAALTSNRSYRKAFDIKQAVEIMIEEVSDYDMKVFLTFQRILHNGRFKGIQELRSHVNMLQQEQLRLFERVAVQDRKIYGTCM